MAVNDKIFYVVTLIVLLIDIIIYSIYPVFNSATETVGGLTIFYFYQMILLIVSSIMFVAVSLIFKNG
jgi:archaellum biogenesis protein FlaJ (TadC family)